MIELRYLNRSHVDHDECGEYRYTTQVLQYRHLLMAVDASGAYCPSGLWSDWIDVPEVDDES